MNEQELRALVRDAVERRLAEVASHSSGLAPQASSPQSRAGHVSHARYLTLVKAGDACFIEPAVRCNHCGYCESHGH